MLFCKSLCIHKSCMLKEMVPNLNTKFHMVVNESWLCECVVMKVTQSAALDPSRLNISSLITLQIWVFWDSPSLAHLWCNSSAPSCAFQSAFSCQCPRLAVESVTLFLRDAQNNPALLPCLLLQATSRHELLLTICLFLNLPCPNHLPRAFFQVLATKRDELSLSDSEQLCLTDCHKWPTSTLTLACLLA